MNVSRFENWPIKSGLQATNVILVEAVGLSTQFTRLLYSVTILFTTRFRHQTVSSCVRGSRRAASAAGQQLRKRLDHQQAFKLPLRSLYWQFLRNNFWNKKLLLLKNTPKDNFLLSEKRARKRIWAKLGQFKYKFGRSFRRLSKHGEEAGALASTGERSNGSYAELKWKSHIRILIEFE